MIYPYENYLTLLLLKGLDNAIVIHKIRSLFMVPPSEEEVEAKRDEVFSLLPEELIKFIWPPSKTSYATLVEQHADCFKAFGVDDLLDVLSGRDNCAWNETLLLMADSTVRVPAQCLVLYGFPKESVAEILKVRYNSSIGIDGLELFIKYFWNISRLSRLEIYNYISAVPNSKIRLRLFDAFHKKDDSIKWNFAGENVLNLEKVLKEVMNEAFAKFRDSVKSPDPEGVHKITKWADLAIKAAEKYDKIYKKESEQLLEALKFKIDKSSQSTITPKDDMDDEVV
jgi:hypothetical protein